MMASMAYGVIAACGDVERWWMGAGNTKQQDWADQIWASLIRGPCQIGGR